MNYVFRDIERRFIYMNLQKNWSKLLGLLLVVVLVYWGVNNIEAINAVVSFVGSAFMPFIIGGALAFILNIPMSFIEGKLTKVTGAYKKWYRAVAIITSFLIVILFFYFLIFLIIPDLQQTITSFIEVVPTTVRSIIEWGTNFIENNHNIVDYVQNLDIDINRLQQEAVSTIQDFATSLIGSTLSLVLSFIDSVVTIFIAVIFAIYILSMKEDLARQFKKLIYGIASLKWANYFVNVAKKASDIFSSFVGGQITEAIILGVLMYVGMTLLGFPYKLSVSAITGALALIPIYGALLGGVVGFILISVVSFPQALGFIVFSVVIQQIEGNLIYPRVVGNSVGLPGIWVMMVVTVGGSLFGLVGMLVAVPTLSLIYSLVSATVNYRLEERNLVIETETSNVYKKFKSR